MKEKHYAYRINPKSTGLVCTHREIEEDKMIDLLKEVKSDHAEGLFWVFRQFDEHSEEPLCIIDCKHNRIYYHYSGDVEPLDEAIKKLTKP